MAAITLKRTARPKALISLVPMIDVLLILLVFFMVTSTYLNLDMIPAAERGDDPGAAATSAPDTPPFLIRISADGRPVLRGQPLSRQELAATLAGRLSTDPQAEVILLPSGGATTQALVSVMDLAAAAGVTRLRVIRLEAR